MVLDQWICNVSPWNRRYLRLPGGFKLKRINSYDAHCKLVFVPWRFLLLFNCRTKVSKQDLYSIIWKNLSGIRNFLLCASLLFFFLVMINLCQPNSAMRCQDTWTNIISECVYEGIFSQINTCTSRQQSRSPSLPWGASSNQLKAWTEQKARQSCWQGAPPASLAARAGSSAPSCLWTWNLKKSALLGFPIIRLFNCFSPTAYSINTPLLRCLESN